MVTDVSKAKNCNYCVPREQRACIPVVPDPSSPCEGAAVAPRLRLGRNIYIAGPTVFNVSTATDPLSAGKLVELGSN